MIPIPVWVSIVAVPYAIFAVIGAVLWKYSRSVATVMVAGGSAAVLLVQVVALLRSFEISAAVRAHQDASYIVVHSHLSSLLAHYVGLVGLWTAAMGLVWHAIRHR